MTVGSGRFRLAAFAPAAKFLATKRSDTENAVSYHDVQYWLATLDQKGLDAFAEVGVGDNK
eukprot:4532119-Alexandrium_andersonii.AAC.1